MTDKPYNGWTGAERNRAGAWLKKAYDAGILQPHDECEVCHRPGPFRGHAEDYSEPYGPHLAEHGLCWSCHMAVHCRFRNPRAWLRYCRLMQEGYCFPPMRHFPTWIELFGNPGYTPTERPNEPVFSTWLDTLAVTREEADQRWAHKVQAGREEPATLW